MYGGIEMNFHAEIEIRYYVDLNFPCCGYTKDILEIETLNFHRETIQRSISFVFVFIVLKFELVEANLVKDLFNAVAIAKGSER